VVEFAERLCYIYDVAGNAPQLVSELVNPQELMWLILLRKAKAECNNSPYLKFTNVELTPEHAHAERVTTGQLVRASEVQQTVRPR